MSAGTVKLVDIEAKADTIQDAKSPGRDAVCLAIAEGPKDQFSNGIYKSLTFEDSGDLGMSTEETLLETALGTKPKCGKDFATLCLGSHPLGLPT
jgi:hypothetical protein